MGFFSFVTSDTDESIPNAHSEKEVFSVELISPKGERFLETAYDGYGVFGGKDIYELIAELNGLSTRFEGIDLMFNSGVPKEGLSLPVLVREGWKGSFEKLKPLRDCESQGFFYR